MGSFPKVYNRDTYIDWHNRNIEPSKDIIVEIDKLLISLKDEQKTRLENLAQLLSRIDSFNLLSRRSQKKDISDSQTDILLEKALRPEGYDLLFKSSDSILDKLWRKNKERTPSNYVTSENIKNEIGDLIRTSVVTSTFEYAEQFANSVLIWESLIKEFNLDQAAYADIEKIESQEEAKMQNGYFAYHLNIRYSDGIRIEVQIYSRLSQIWRHLSHRLYERVRLGNDVSWGHGTAASRLVSLGHLLHLAECEVEYLKETMG
ncbi:hypothetical protein [Massilia timonae]|uniref:hypothetical protein n=1 Tax=Massilia timonae TaxID=47229 RepID=UPI002897F60E|nr:hypothetical protein [Massilia timonae]